MSRLTSIKRLAVAALAAAGVIAACRAAQPSEAPPLAPRPEIGPSTDPVPGAPDPLAPPSPTPKPTVPTNDAGPTVAPKVTQLDPSIFQSSAIRMQPGWDAGTGDAPPDSSTLDARILQDAAPDALTDGGRDALAGAPGRDAPGGAPGRDAAAPSDGRRAPRDGRVPDASDGATDLPPNPDASLPSDGARPLH